MASVTAIAKLRTRLGDALRREGSSHTWWLWRRGLASERHLSPIMLRILAVNVMALAILVGSLLYLGRYQDRIVASDLDALLLEARITASAVAEDAVVIGDDDRIILSPLLARPMVRRMAEATGARTRLFETDSTMLADSRVLLDAVGRLRETGAAREGFGAHAVAWLFDVIDLIPEREKYPVYEENELQRGDQYDLVRLAMRGNATTEVWTLPEGGLMLAAAAPVQHYKEVLGTVMLTRDGDKIDEAVRDVRMDILKIFSATLFITILLSLYLARVIARPVRLLAAAAENLRAGQTQVVGLAGSASLLRRETIPDMTARNDEIGDLSGALRDLTDALAKRLGAIENFAADVAHELKNPLTSLRSAIETAERIEDPERRKKLMLVIRDDVDRLDRLISDIANASRVDAELSRAAAEPIDIGKKLEMLADYYRGAAGAGEAEVVLEPAPENLVIMGVPTRLAQVFQNLIDNAISFSPPNGKVVLSVSRAGQFVQVKIEDSGPGIPENKLAAIFDRFYSERPKAEKFGTHSGLGLSISKQIVEAHRGSIRAENRYGDRGEIIGSRFIVQLPAAG